MTPAAFKEARHTLGLTLSQAARLLGYQGKHAMQQVRQMESGDRAIRAPQVRLMRAYLDGYRPEDWPDSAAP